MIEIIVLILKIVSILYFVGYGLTSILLPQKLREDSFFIIPWVGLIFIAIMGISLSMAKIPLINGKNIISIFAFILIIYAVIIKKIIFSFSRETFVISLLCIVNLLFNLFPLLVKFGYPTTISLSNLDPLSYVNVAEHLIKNPILIRQEFFSTQPHFRAIGDLLYYSYRWGSPVILSFFSSILEIRSYKIYTILISLIFSLTFPLVYLLAKLFVANKTSKLLILFTFLAYGLNSTILYMLYNAFFAQFIFTGIFILTVILLHSYFFDESVKKIELNSYDLLIALCISSLASVYPEGLVFAVSPLVIFLFLKLFSKDRFKFFVALLKIALLTLLINPFLLGTTLSWDYRLFFSSTKSTFIGWEKVRYSSFFEMTGLYNLFYYRSLPRVISILINIPIILVCLAGLSKIKNKIFIISYLAIFSLFYFIYWIIYPNYYLHLKLVTYLLFVFTIVFSIGLIQIINIFKNKILKILIVLIFTLLSLRSAHRTIYQLYYHPRSVDKKLISLEQLNKSNKITSTFYTSDVFLGEYDLWKRLWQEYLLSDKQIITRTNYLEENDLEDIKLVLSEKDVQEYDHKKIVYKNIVWSNEYYLLGEIEQTKFIKDLQNK